MATPLIDTTFGPSAPDSRDHPVSLAMPTTLPASVDLKPWVEEVEDQGQLGSCTANAGCSALELAYVRAGKPSDFSRLYLYFYERQLEGSTTDSGAAARDIGKALNKYGVCLESTWAYDISKFNVEPSAGAQAEAKNYPTYAYESITGAPADVIAGIKGALALGVPVLTTLAVHRSFYTIAGPWKQHSWDVTTSTNNPIVGYHEVLIIGYDEAAQRFLTENSWGPAWGDGGFFGIPYSMIGNEVSEWWILSKIGVDYIPIDGPQPQPTPTPSTDSTKWMVYGIMALVVGFFIYNLFVH